MLGTITLTVEQQEPSNGLLNEEPVENIEVTPNDEASKDSMEQDGLEEASEAITTTIDTEVKEESPEQANENQSNEVGFKKVFKFVGFKFTVKKDKTEKADPVQLVTVQKDEVEVNGADNNEKQSSSPVEDKPVETQETKDVKQELEKADVAVEENDSPKETFAESPTTEDEPKVEKEQKKSPVSPANPIVAESSSPFKRFFTQGWAGLRKKTSFRKSKEEDPQEVEKHIESEQEDKVEVQDVVKQEEPSEKEAIIEDQSLQEKAEKSENEEVNTFIDEEITASVAEQSLPDESLSSKLEEFKTADKEKAEDAAPVTESVLPESEKTENVVDVVVEIAAPVLNELSEIITQTDVSEEITAINITEISSTSPPSSDKPLQVVEIHTETLEKDVKGEEDLTEEQSQLVISTECVELEKSQEAVITEAELLSSQDKAKLQGSPLKKLFSGSGLRKLSGKKYKGKKEDDAKTEDVAQQATVSSESPEAPGADGGESSPSSPDDSGETSPSEKNPEETQQTTETEGEGATSDGERKKDGITPWASFKKLVTPKKRPKRPSESDKEDDIEKVKSSTMSSTESAGYVDNQEEVKDNNEEQKLEKSTEENKKKVDSSVSWEALICVGSSKKRARKTSDSEEEAPNNLEENKKIEEDVGNVKELDADGPHVSSQEKEQDSSSPDQANSPTEGDGVSTWQSFKRLVTPRRKSKSRAEDKIEEPTVTSSMEQSTSEGEAGKEETWVSLKKLIPGRKKKKSDGKLDQGAINESGQAVIQSEMVEDDFDEPAVVPLAEFDAAEQEKLEAQKSVDVCVFSDASKDQLAAQEKSNDGLIHAVTVTVIEGERAVTSLEERSPSWISATVTETIEKENGHIALEGKEEITTELKVEESVIFSTVSHVDLKTTNDIINDVELTAEAIIALEEAIETSCAEETTEMVSAVSQLGESLLTTEDTTPVPEEDASTRSLEKQKKHTDKILQEVAEKAKLSVDALIESSSSLQGTFSLFEKIDVKEQRQAEDTDPLVETAQGEENCTENKTVELDFCQTSVCVTTFTENTLEKSIVPTDEGAAILLEEHTKVDFSKTVDQNAKEYISTLNETNVVEEDPIVAADHTNEEILSFVEKQGVECFQTAAEKNTAVEIVPVVFKEQADHVLTGPAEKNVEVPFIPTTGCSAGATPLLADVFAVQQEKDVSPSNEQLENVLVHEKTSKHESVSILDTTDVTLISVEPQTEKHSSFLIQEESEKLSFSEVQSCKSVVILAQEENEKSAGVPTLTYNQVEETILVLAEEQTGKDTSSLSDEPVKDAVPTVPEEKTEESTSVLDEKVADVVNSTLAENTAKCVPKLAEEKSDVLLTLDQSDEVISVLSENQTHDGISVLPEKPSVEVSPILTDDDFHNVPVSIEEKVKVVPYLGLTGPGGDAPIFFEKQSDEGLPILVEKSNEEGSNVLTVENADIVHVLALEQVGESADVLTEKETDEYICVLAKKPVDEIRLNLSEEQAEKVPILTKEQDALESVLDKADNGVHILLDEKPAVEISSVLTEEKTENLTTLIKEKAEIVPDLALDQAKENSPIVDDDDKLTDGSISSSVELLADDIKPILIAEQAKNDSVLFDENPEFISNFSLNKADQSATIVAEKETDESVSVLLEKPAEVESPIITDEQVKESPVFIEIEEKAELVSVLVDQVEGSVPDLADKNADISPVLTNDQNDVNFLVGEESIIDKKLVSKESEVTLAEEQNGDITLVLTQDQSGESEHVLVKEEKETLISAVEQEQVANQTTKVSLPDFTGLATEANLLITSSDTEQTESVFVFTDKKVAVEQSLKFTQEECTLDLEEQFSGESTTFSTEKQHYDESSLSSEKDTNVSAEECSVLLVQRDVASSFISVEKESSAAGDVVEKGENVQDEQESIESDVMFKKDKESVNVETEQIVSDSTPEPAEKHILESIVEKKETIEISVSLEAQTENTIPIVPEEENVQVPNVLASLTDTIEPVEDQHLESAFIDNDQANETEINSTPTPLNKIENSGESEMKVKTERELKQCDESKSVAYVSLHSSVVEGELEKVGVEVVTTNIPELESSEANKASEPVAAAAVEEPVLAETVKPIETSQNVQLFQRSENANIIPSEEYVVSSGTLHTVVESISQTAAAIVDATIEAAAGCMIVDAVSYGGELEEKTGTENGISVSWEDEPTVQKVEDETVQTISIESHSSTIVQKIIETAVEKVVNSVQDNDCDNILKSQNLEENISEVQQTVLISSCKEIDIELKQDCHPSSSDSCISITNLDVGQVEKEIICESVKFVSTTAYREHQEVFGGDESRKEVFVIRDELETKGNAGEDLVDQKTLEPETGNEQSAPDCESVQLCDLVDQISTETVQIIQAEIKPNAPSLIPEEQTPSQDDCLAVKTEEIAQNVES
ncbi:A-kinase anchor 12 [Pelobates cultripes]|uniref:A-kinase anchor 12 n=1 Tax=Pelobates cultripes TaxID=61616 RepID=A0AAD1RD77_PELCU|nr:A-kinase anchor 12 [Pelobates cultripes]